MKKKAIYEDIIQYDYKIIEILEKRAEALKKHYKKYDESLFEIENRIMRDLSVLKTKNLKETHKYMIFREILSANHDLIKPMKVGFLGPEASFTHEASKRKFGNSVKYLPFLTMTDVFQAVSSHQVDFGIVPLENSIEGVVTTTCDLLMESGKLKIYSEIVMNVAQNLMYNCETDEIKLIVSHPQGLAQCRKWLDEYLPNVPREAMPSTSLAAKRAAQEEGVAAIGSSTAIDQYKIKNIKKSIQDDDKNTTRFIVLAHNWFPKQTGDDKTSIMFSVSHKSGSLHQALYPFDYHRVNLTRIESRPSKRINWEYSFFIDFEGYVARDVIGKLNQIPDKNKTNIERALEEVERITDDFMVLGSYPREIHIVKDPPMVEPNQTKIVDI